MSAAIQSPAASAIAMAQQRGVNLSSVSQPTVKSPSLKIDVSQLGPDELKQFKQLDEAAKSFEQIFVQQLLKTADFGSKATKGGHGAMALEAMATGVTQGGGMGLATLIRDSMIQNQLPGLASALQPEVKK